MPVAHVRVLKGHSPEQLRQVVVDVSAVVMKVLQAPADRLEVWVTEIDHALWGISGFPAQEALLNKSMYDVEMPFIQMVLMEGRSKEQHHALIDQVTAAVANALGANKERIRIHISETKPDLWGIGGVPASIRRAAEIQARAAGEAA